MPSIKSVVLTATLSVALTLPVAAHIERSEPLQSLRQSYYALLGMTFGPMGDMVKGEIDWDGARFARWADDLAAVASVQVERGFQPGSEQGKTRAKPEIWLDMEDFEGKLADLRREAAALAAVAKTDDVDAIKAQFGATGKTCKACHDEYKARDYLY